MKKNKSWTVVMVDNRTNEFNVFANISDDTFITYKVAEAQRLEMDVRTFTTEEGFHATIKKFEEMGYKFKNRSIFEEYEL